jgi:hypothetical protein
MSKDIRWTDSTALDDILVRLLSSQIVASTTKPTAYTMCKYAKQMRKFKECKNRSNPHVLTTKVITDLCETKKELQCEKLELDTKTAFGSVSVKGPCPLCPQP